MVFLVSKYLTVNTLQSDNCINTVKCCNMLNTPQIVCHYKHVQTFPPGSNLNEHMAVPTDS